MSEASHFYGKRSGPLKALLKSLNCLNLKVHNAEFYYKPNEADRLQSPMTQVCVALQLLGLWPQASYLVSLSLV